jgi:hypothetical protein
MTAGLTRAAISEGPATLASRYGDLPGRCAALAGGLSAAGVTQ